MIKITEKLIKDLESIPFTPDLLPTNPVEYLERRRFLEEKIKDFDALLKFHGKIYPK